MSTRELLRLRDDGSPFERRLLRSAANDGIAPERRSGFFTTIEAAAIAPSGVIAIGERASERRETKRRRAR